MGTGNVPEVGFHRTIPLVALRRAPGDVQGQGGDRRILGDVEVPAVDLAAEINPSLDRAVGPHDPVVNRHTGQVASNLGRGPGDCLPAVDLLCRPLQEELRDRARVQLGRQAALAFQLVGDPVSIGCQAAAVGYGHDHRPGPHREGVRAVHADVECAGRCGRPDNGAGHGSLVGGLLHQEEKFTTHREESLVKDSCLWSSLLKEMAQLFNWL